MKGLKENKGFTLIELLAVIVVLAIVMVLAVTTVLPYMTQARKEAFALEANTASNAASSAMSLIMIGSLETDYYTYDETNKEYCFTVENLMEAGLYEKDEKDANDNYVYQGVVKVTQTSGKAYTYEVSLKNDQYYVNAVEGEVDQDDVKEGAAPSGFVTTCS